MKRSSCRSLLVLAACFLLSSPLRADLADARDAIDRGDYRAAASEYARLAGAGNAVAQANLGYMYYTGEGVERDYGEAVKWYRKAAEQGNADAQYNLAVAYAFGEGVERDYGEAVKWYRQAADQGHVLAQYSLAISYATGEGLEKDPGAAVHWFRQAAEQGYVSAQVQLASKYHTGDGVERDMAEAARWYREAAEGGNPVAQYNLAGLYEAGTGVPRDADQALYWYRQAAVQGYGAAQKELSARQDDSAKAANEGQLLALEGIEPSLPKQQHQPGADLLASRETSPVREQDNAAVPEPEPPARDAVTPPEAVATTAEPSTDAGADAGESQKHNFLKRLFGSDEGRAAGDDDTTPAAGAMTETTADAAPGESATDADAGNGEPGFFKRLFGKSGAADEEAAVAVADEAGSTEEPERPGYDPALYEEGMAALDNGNPGAAVSSLREGARQGDPRAQYRLGTLYYQGLGVSQSYGEASRWYRLAAENGNADAQYSLGNMYFLGEGVEQDDNRAGYWYEKAAAQGHVSARHNLSNLKRVMEVAGRRYEVVAGDDDAALEDSTDDGQPKRGFFERLFDGDDADQKPPPKQNDAAPAQPAGKDEPRVSRSTQDSGKKDDGFLSFMHKDNGGLFGHLFGWGMDDEERPQGGSEAPARPQNADAGAAQSRTAVDGRAPGTEPADPTDSATRQTAGGEEQASDKGRLSFMHKDNGGLFGHLFGWGMDDDEGEQQSGEASGDESRERVARAAASSPSPSRATGVPQTAVADYRRGLGYYLGDGVPENPEAALEYFRRSADAGYAPAQYHLGMAYAYGKGTRQDKQEAARWYRQAATRDYAPAQRTLGLMYAEGDGVEQDKIRALAWFSILAEGGNVRDIQHRDDLVRELSPEQIAESHYLKTTLQAQIDTARR